jgi:hypothetical protein
MAWIIFVLATLVMLGRFADFLLGPKGDRMLKDRLIDFYVLAGDYDYTRLASDSAAMYHSFLLVVFGELNRSRTRLAISVGIYSGISSLVIWFLFLMRAFGTAWEGLNWTLSALPVLLPLIMVNYVIDLVSFEFAKLGTNKAKYQGKRIYLALLIVLPALIYLALALGNFLFDIAFRIYYVIYTFVGWNFFFEHDFQFLWRATTGDFADSLIRPLSSNLNLRNLDNISFSILTILPLTTLYMFVGLVMITFWLRRYVRSILLLFIDRVESSQAGVCTLFASGLAVMISVVTALAGALK